MVEGQGRNSQNPSGDGRVFSQDSIHGGMGGKKGKKKRKINSEELARFKNLLRTNII